MNGKQHYMTLLFIKQYIMIFDLFCSLQRAGSIVVGVCRGRNGNVKLDKIWIFHILGIYNLWISLLNILFYLL